MQKKLSLTDVVVKDKKVLMRVDFNVPIDKQGNITDDTRIAAALPSIQYVLDHGGALILMSHLGRPKDGYSKDLSLAPCAKRLSEILKKPVLMASDCVGDAVEAQVKNLQPGQVLLLENLRFHRAEERPNEDPEFVQKLARLGDVYVNDAFGTAHRAHSSTALIAKYFPDKSAAGLLMQKEIQFLGENLLNPKRPFYAIIGGAKISSKIGLIKSLLHKADKVMIGGGMAYTFFKAQGISIGDSIHEDDYLNAAREILEESRTSQAKLLLPQDCIVADAFSNDANTKIIDCQQGIPAGFQGMDIGPKTIKAYLSGLVNAKTIFWNGPVGVFEFSNFAKGTNSIAQGLSTLPAVTVVGGGESVAAIHAAGVSDKISHISTGGGAALEYIEFGTLPGIDTLTTKNGSSL